MAAITAEAVLKGVLARYGATLPWLPNELRKD
jgi:hypothetical protein